MKNLLSRVSNSATCGPPKIILSFIYVPIKTVNKSSLLECFKVKEIYINNRLINNVLVGTIDSKLYLDNIDCLLNNKLKGEII